MTTAVLERSPAVVAPPEQAAAVKDADNADNAGDWRATDARLPLAGRLHLNLAALGVDPNAPDFGERLCQLSQDNPPYDFEISAQGELIVMPPSGWESNIGEKGINAPLFFWCMDHDGFDVSQTVLFRLPSGARYMPDAAWITQERYAQLLAEEYRSAIDGAPDFVVEVRSRTDRLAYGLARMQEWMDGGAQLGWYLDPYQTRAYIYRIGQPVEILDNPETLSGEAALPGFVFAVRRLIFARHPAVRNPNPNRNPNPPPHSHPHPHPMQQHRGRKYDYHRIHTGTGAGSSR